MAENGKHIEFVETLQNQFKCGICKLVLCTPFQTICGHRYCEGCIKGVIRSSKMCPEDNTVLSMEHIFPDKFCEGQIMKLETRCSNKHRGCNWKGPLQMFKDHQSECPKHLLACPNGCQAIVPRLEMENHFTNVCPFAHTSCPMVGQCDFQGSRAELREHLEKTNAEHMFMAKHKISVLEEQMGKQQAVICTLRNDLADLYALFRRYVTGTQEVNAD